MNPVRNIFEGKHITQMGLGLLGRGIGDAAFLARNGAVLTVTDMKDEIALADSLKELSAYPDITFHLRGHRIEDFQSGDLVLKGAGVPLDSPYIKESRVAGVPVDMSASLFARIANIPLVGITGTRGKSTVTHLVHAIVVHAGRKTLLGGNVRGVSNLALLDDVTPDHVGVFELDSWQCQGFAEEASLNVPGVRQGPLSPHIAAFTTFMPDHMNYYDGSMEAYLEDKAQIFLHQTADDVLVIGRQAEEVLAPYRNRMRGHIVIADETTLPDEWSFSLPGVHNRYNAGIALAIVRALGIPDDITREVMSTYRALSGRLEYVDTNDAVRVYNDNNATTPDATAVALRALDPERSRSIILIMGGADKGLALDVLRTAIGDHVRAVILIPGSGTVRFKEEHVSDSAEEVPTLALAYARARELAASGDIILFSPAFASFGAYANEYERNDEFMNLVTHASHHE